MQTIALSADAVAVRRSEIKGWPPKNKAGRLQAYRELAAAGIMEPVPGSDTDYRFTQEGMEHKGAILEREADRIERERNEEPDAENFSGPARELLRRCIEHGFPEGDESNRPAYCELVKARIMVPMGAFSKGDECVFRFTYWGYKMRFELAEMDCARENT
jgi:hypothetical protein